MSFVLGAACILACIQADPFLVRHPEATESILYCRSRRQLNVALRHRHDSGFVGSIPIRVYDEAPPSIGN